MGGKRGGGGGGGGDDGVVLEGLVNRVRGEGKGMVEGLSV